MDNKKPIAKTDAVNSSNIEDKLGIKEKCHGIAQFIKECDTPMTVAIQGDWGTGKTTAMNIIRQKLIGDKPDPEVFDYTIWFNTWEFSVLDSGSLFVNLMMKLMDEIAETLPKNNDIKEILKEALSNFLEIALAVGEVVIDNGLISNIKDALKNTNKKKKQSDNAENNPNGKISYLNRVIELKKNIETAVNMICTDDKRLYFFIDDLDRLEPAIAVGLLECIKNFLDIKNCVFVMAIDREVVDRGLKSKYGADFSDKKAERFFDKIIQVPYELPVTNYIIEDYVKALCGNDENSKKYEELLKIFGENNPRSIKRIFNLMKLHECMLENIDNSDNEYEKDNNDSRLRLFALVMLQIEALDEYKYFNSNLSLESNDYTDYILADKDDETELYKKMESYYKYLGEHTNENGNKSEESIKLLQKMAKLLNPYTAEELNEWSETTYLEQVCGRLTRKLPDCTQKTSSIVGGAAYEYFVDDIRVVKVSKYNNKNGVNVTLYFENNTALKECKTKLDENDWGNYKGLHITEGSKQYITIANVEPSRKKELFSILDIIL